MRTSPESLIDLESLYLISRTGNLDLLHFENNIDLPLSSKVVSSYRLEFKQIFKETNRLGSIFYRIILTYKKVSYINFE